jgi:hypothetical protein
MTGQSGVLSVAVPAVATLAAAVITGIAAAALKHRWDVAADVRQKRWEEAGRRRQECLDALTAYLVARPTLAAVRRQRNEVRPGALIDLDAMLSEYRLAYARLLIALTEKPDRDVIEVDNASLEQWLSDVATDIGSRTPSRNAPVTDDVVALARDISGRSAFPATSPHPTFRQRLIARVFIRTPMCCWDVTAGPGQ